MPKEPYVRKEYGCLKKRNLIDIKKQILQNKSETLEFKATPQ